MQSVATNFEASPACGVRRHPASRVPVARMLIPAILFTASLILTPTLQAQISHTLSPAASERNYDARLELPDHLLVHAPGPRQDRALADLRQAVPDLLHYVEPSTGVTRSLVNPTGFLTRSDLRGEPRDLALDFVISHLDLLGLTPEDLEEQELTDSVYSDLSGTTHLYFRQVHQGIPVYNGQLQINVGRDGKILGVHNGYVPELAAAAAARGFEPALAAGDAVERAAKHLGIALSQPVRSLSAADGPRRKTSVDPSGVSQSPIDAQLMWLPISRGNVRLVWNLSVETLDGEHYYDLTVDAHSGKVWTRFDWTAGASYRVYPQPVESPNHTTPLPPSDGRSLVVNPADSVASPNGWHSTGSSSFTIPRGNNVHAYEDRDGNNSPPSSQPNCGSSLACDFAINLTGAPSTYIPAAVTNLFYWNNVIHDVQYQYGFNEAAGNFQVNNFGRGGAGNDDVRAEAQDGGGTNNANFSTPPDGSRPRMQMYVWTAPTPDKDGDLDNGIIIHEYGHGISIRQVGGPSNSSCLNNTQQPGEGWSDWFALAYTAEVGDGGTDRRGIGTYALNQATTGTGIRTQPYSTSSSINTWTYATISTGVSVPHGVGAVWAQGLWEVYWKLVDHWGFDPDLYDAQGGAGNQRAMLYVNEGLKNTACSPTFLQARDGIIQAAASLHNGEDVCRLWEAFAAYGLGVNATTGGSNSLSATNGFNVPSSCSGGPPPPPPPGCTTPATLYNNTFDSASGLSDWTRGSFVSGGSVTDWRGVQTCTAQSGSRIFRFGGSTCTSNYGSNRFAFAQPRGATGIAVPSGSSTTRLSFGHRRRFENGFDGGTLTLSLDGSNYFFVDGLAMVSGGYNGTLSNSCPPAGAGGAPVWTGVQTSFGNTEVDLDLVCNAITGGTGGCAGQNLFIGFTSITDCSVTDDGWFLDNVKVTACTP